VARLIARCLALEPDPAEVRVVIETRHGLVEALVDAGFTVLPVNPDPVARRRGPAKKKDDAEDARICCLLALDAYLELRALITHGQNGAELRAIARDERRLGNRLRADLPAVFGAAIDIADGDPDAPVFLKLIERWPSYAELATATREEPTAFARLARHGRPEAIADRVLDALARPRLVVRPELARAKVGSIRLAAAQLLLLRTQRHQWSGGWASCCPAARAPGATRASRTPTRGSRSRAARST